MSGQIFISYRREESRWSARSLNDRLCRDFDPKQIFMDIDTIALGEDFVDAIETTVAKCDVLIAVIGNNWLTSKDEHGTRRLDNPQDFVRMEIGTALKRKIRVIPVLVDRASMPPADDLPEDLKPLARRNALVITDTSFEGDCQRLAAAIREVLERAAPVERERLATEQREREDESNDRTVPLIPAPPHPEAERHKESEAEQSQSKRENNDRTGRLTFPPPHPETPPDVQSKASTGRKPLARVTLVAVAVLILIGGLIYVASRRGREAVSVTPKPTPELTPTPTPVASPTLTPAPTPTISPLPTPTTSATPIGQQPLKASINPPADSLQIPSQATQSVPPKSRILVDKRFQSKDKVAEYAVTVVDVQGVLPSETIPFCPPFDRNNGNREITINTNPPRYFAREYKKPVWILWEYKGPVDSEHHDPYRAFKDSLLIQ